MVEEKEERRAKVADRRSILEQKFNPRNGISRHARDQYHAKAFNTSEME